MLSKNLVGALLMSWACAVGAPALAADSMSSHPAVHGKCTQAGKEITSAKNAIACSRSGGVWTEGKVTPGAAGTRGVTEAKDKTHVKKTPVKKAPTKHKGAHLESPTPTAAPKK